ncbi:MAG: hypothetical protein ACP5G0_05920 [Desulfomonilia bacterium]
MAKLYVFAGLVFFLVFLLPGMTIASDGTNEPAQKEETLLRRIDFGNSYILGQTITSGAVYLLQRKKSEIKSMLPVRENYRQEILEGFPVKTSCDPGETAPEVSPGK